MIEFARDVADMADANSQEFDAETTHPVVSTMADQTDVVNGERDMGGTMRLGLPRAADSRQRRGQHLR